MELSQDSKVFTRYFPHTYLTHATNISRRLQLGALNDVVSRNLKEPEQFMSDSAEILIFTQSDSMQRIVQLSDAFRQVCSAEQGQIFSFGPPI